MATVGGVAGEKCGPGASKPWAGRWFGPARVVAYDTSVVHIVCRTDFPLLATANESFSNLRLCGHADTCKPDIPQRPVAMMISRLQEFTAKFHNRPTR
jgi:hypothetical protein